MSEPAALDLAGFANHCPDRFTRGVCYLCGQQWPCDARVAADEMARCRAERDALKADDLDTFMRRQAEDDPTFAASFFNRQGESLLRLWLEAWDTGGRYPVEATRAALGEVTQ